MIEIFKTFNQQLFEKKANNNDTKKRNTNTSRDAKLNKINTNDLFALHFQ